MAGDELGDGSGSVRGQYFNLEGPAGYTGQPAPGEIVEFDLVKVDLDTLQETKTRVPFHGHSLVTTARHPDLVWLIQKWNQNACCIDTRAGVVRKHVTLPRGRQFIGHGVFTRDESQLLVSEGLFPDTPVNYAEGVIARRDPLTLELMGEFPSYGQNPHEIRLIRNGTVLAVCNQGTVNRFPETPSNLAYIDVRTGKLIEKVELSRKDILMAHMRELANDDLVIVTKSRDSDVWPPSNQVLVRAGTRPLRALDVPPEHRKTFFNEILSLDVDESRKVVATTCPAAKVVAFWDLETLRLKTVIEGFGRPMSIALTGDGQRYIVGDMEQGLAVIDASELVLESGPIAQALLGHRFTAPHSHLVG